MTPRTTARRKSTVRAYRRRKRSRTSVACMQYRRVGRSGLEVSRLALGTMSWGAAVDAYEAEDQLKTFLDAGGTLVDTAPIYGDGNCEELLGTLLAKTGVRDRIVLAGKAALVHRNGEVVARCVPQDAARTARPVAQAARHRSPRPVADPSVGRAHPDRGDAGDARAGRPLAARSRTSASPTSPAGRPRWLTPGWLVAPTHCRSSAPRWSTRCCTASPRPRCFAAAEHHGMGILAWSPLGRGVLTGKYRAGIPADSRGCRSRMGRLRVALPDTRQVGCRRGRSACLGGARRHRCPRVAGVAAGSTWSRVGHRRRAYDGAAAGKSRL